MATAEERRSEILGVLQAWLATPEAIEEICKAIAKTNDEIAKLNIARQVPREILNIPIDI